MTKYRALLITPTAQERPVQTLTPSLHDAEDWAKLTLKTAAPGSHVIFSVSAEIPLHTMSKQADGSLTVKD